MAIPTEIFLYAIWNKNNHSYFVNPDGSVDSSAEPRFLKHKPIGWKDIELSFNTVDKYFSNVKALSIPIQYIADGAQILRKLMYIGKGIYEEIYCVIFKLNHETMIHELEYKGLIDLLTAIDDPETGITINAKEGGLQADLDANESIIYELPLSNTNTVAEKVFFSGIDLFDKFYYESFALTIDIFTSIYTVTTTNTEAGPVTTYLRSIETPYVIIPLVYLSNEGDSINIEYGGQIFEQFKDESYLKNSANTLFKNNNQRTVITHIDSVYKFSISEKYVLNSPPGQFKAIIYVQTPDVLMSYEVATLNVDILNSYEIPINIDIPVPFNSKMFIVFRFPTELTPLTSRDIKYEVSFADKNQVFLSFSSIAAPSSAYALRTLDIANQLVKKWNDKYSVQSTFLSEHNNIVCTSGQALRNLANAVLKYSFKDFFDDFNYIYCLCINIIGNVMYIESRESRYKVGTDTRIFDLGTVSGFKIKPGSRIFSNVKTGWPDQNYDARNGKYEFNSEVQWKFPGNLKGENLELIGKGRADGYGIELIRSKLNNKDTTDNEGDNQVFMINTEQRNISADIVILVNNIFPASIILTDMLQNYVDFEIGDKIRLEKSMYNNRAFTVLGKSEISGNQYILWIDDNSPVTPETTTGVTIILGKLSLKRKIYSYLNGVPTYSIFNVEEMTPARKLRAWGSYLHSLLFQLPTEKITFQTSLKNKELKTTLNNITITEKEDIQVAFLSEPFFLNYNASFTTKVPLTFNKTLSNMLSVGNVKVVYNGFDIFFLPIGKMTSKPATNDAQEWELTLSAYNNLETLYKLSQESLYISDGNNNTMNISILCPVHFVYYNKELNVRYKYKDLYDDWVHRRNDQFAVQPHYFQKWELADMINLQFITNGGIGQLEIYVYDAWAKELNIIQSLIIGNPSVRSPYVLQQVNINPNDYGEGNFLFAIKSNGITLALSEWQNFAEKQYSTYIIDYSNSYNKLNAYFADYKPMIRVEAFWGAERAESNSTDYQDENRIQTLSFNTYTVKKIYFGYPYGIPEWLHIKLNNILFLDTVNIEGTRYSRPNENKFEISERSGYPLNVYSIDLRRSNSNIDFSVNAEGIRDTIGAVYTLSAEAYGQATGVIEVKIDVD